MFCKYFMVLKFKLKSLFMLRDYIYGFGYVIYKLICEILCDKIGFVLINFCCFCMRNIRLWYFIDCISF